MTLEMMMDALRDLGREKWIRPSLGVQPTDQPKLFGHPFDVDSLNYSLGDWIWPEDLKVGFELEWLSPVATSRLQVIDASIAQPVNLVVTYSERPVVGIAGLVLARGWTDPDLDLDFLEEPAVIGIPDNDGRVMNWECRSLASALEMTVGLVMADPLEVVDHLGIRLVD